MHTPIPSPVASAIAVSLLAPCSTALAGGGIDLQLDEIQVRQAIRFAGTPLVAGNATFVRARITSLGAAGATDNVDALMRVFVDGAEASFSPVKSMNAPVTLPPFPAESEIGESVNFWFIAPESGNVDIQVEVNPDLVIPEGNLANNIGSVDDLVFQCRAVVELPYVPIDYVPGGGVPDEGLIEPGIGDGFLRAIYSTGEWNYHRYPLPPLVWTQNINDSNSVLLNTLSDIRVMTLPDAGYPQPPLIYGWLPGNPFSGNGQANGIPGDAAFGNTDPARHQRTFAHEIGHLLNEGHNSETVGQWGIDAEHHLLDTEGLARLHAPQQNDIMVAGQLTNTAFVSPQTYNQTHGDARLQCGAAAAGGPPPVPVMRVSGVLNHVTGTLALDPVHVVDRGLVSADRPGGLVWVVARDAAGAELHRVLAADGSTREPCSDAGAENGLLDTSPLHVLIPAWPGGIEVHSVEAVDVATGRILDLRERSPNPPQISFDGIVPEGGAAIDLLGPRVRVAGRVGVTWTAADDDGDDLSYILLYSPDGGARWQPVAVNLTEPGFWFDAGDLPASDGATGVLRLRASDGLNETVIDSPPMTLGGDGPPSVYLLTPNDGETFAEEGNVILHAYAYDNEDQMISDAISWTSSVDGPLGTGGLIQTDVLSEGHHTITASVVDGGLNPAMATIEISITPRVVPLAFTYPDGLPAYVAPSGDAVRVVITPLAGAELDPSTPALHYDAGGGRVEVPLAFVGGDEWDMVFPPLACGTLVQYYVSADTLDGDSVASPSGAPLTLNETTAAFGSVVEFHDDFELDLGWTTAIVGATSGQWQRGIPVNDGGWAYDPATDGDGSGQCFLTQNEFGNTDVDNGSVQLMTPVLDLSGGNQTILFLYYLRLTNTSGVDRLLVEASVGGPWMPIVAYTDDSGEAWLPAEITPDMLAAAGVLPSSTTQFRFTANDGEPQSIVEAGIDGFTVDALDCTPCKGTTCLADLDCDGAVGTSDLLDLLAAWGTNPGGPPDIDGDGNVGTTDLLELLAAWGECP